MKIQFTEDKFGVNIKVTPETPREVGMLFRMTRNAKAVKPSIYMSFSPYNTDECPYCSIDIQKINIDKQINSLSK